MSANSSYKWVQSILTAIAVPIAAFFVLSGEKFRIDSIFPPKIQESFRGRTHLVLKTRQAGGRVSSSAIMTGLSNCVLLIGVVLNLFALSVTAMDSDYIEIRCAGLYSHSLCRMCHSVVFSCLRFNIHDSSVTSDLEITCSVFINKILICVRVYVISIGQLVKIG
jgi:hypothetical protein